jgi:hypothetical protein
MTSSCCSRRTRSIAFFLIFFFSFIFHFIFILFFPLFFLLSVLLSPKSSSNNVNSATLAHPYLIMYSKSSPDKEIKSNLKSYTSEMGGGLAINSIPPVLYIRSIPRPPSGSHPPPHLGYHQHGPFELYLRWPQALQPQSAHLHRC